MTDLTAITTPFGLLDRETQEALKAHGGPYEWWHGVGWHEAASTPAWDPHFVYRVKPAPPKPREWWLRMTARGDICGTDPVDGDPPPNWDPSMTVRVREVLPE